MSQVVSTVGPNDDILGQFVLQFEAAADKALVLRQFTEQHPHLADEFRQHAATDQLLKQAGPGESSRPPALPDYEILEELTPGGMGIVYRARHLSLKRVVALKLIRGGDLAGAEERARFRAEAEAVAQLQHPHIVQVYEIGEHQGNPYFSMEYVAGGSLARKLRQNGKPVPALEAARLVETLSRAMHYAHQRGVVHRDLKPGNVLLTDDGLAKIADFGLAKRLDASRPDASGLTRTGAVVGTASYMAPEQAARKVHGKLQPVGPRADVYALGAILYELLTSRPPFLADTTLETLEQVRTQEPVEPMLLQARTPRDLNTICLKCLNKDPAGRYASAEALAEDLRRFQAGEPIQARPVGRIEKAWRWCRRNPLAAALTSGIFLVLALGIGTSSYFLVQAQEREKARLLEKARAEDEERKNYQQKYLAAMRLIPTYWEAGRVAWLEDLLEAQRPEHSGGLELRGFEWHYWRRRCHSKFLTFQGEAGAFSSDGKKLAASWKNQINIWDLESGKKLQELPGHQKPITTLAFSPDSARIASGSYDKTVKIWDLKKGKELQTFREHKLQSDLQQVDFTPDGREVVFVTAELMVVWNPKDRVVQTFPRVQGRTFALHPTKKLVASGYQDGSVILVDRETGEDIGVLRGHTADVVGLAFSPDGQSLISSSMDGTVIIWDATKLKKKGVRKSRAQYLGRVVWSPKGRRFATWANDNIIVVWDVADAEKNLTLRGHTQPITGLSFSPDSLRLASYSADGKAGIWDAIHGQAPSALQGHSKSVVKIRFSPDGKWLASASSDKTVKLWDVAARREKRTWHEHKDSVYAVAFSPDGTLLASAGKDRTIKIWEIAGGRELKSLQGHQDTIWSLAFTPDGTHLCSGGADRIVIVWDWASGKEAGRITGFQQPVSGLAIACDNSRLVLATVDWDSSGKLWDLTAPQGNRVMPSTILQSKLAQSMWEVTFSPDGKTLATAQNAGWVKLWDAHTGKELRSFLGHTYNVSGVVFSPDGRRLATAGWDKTVKLWDIASGQEVLSLAHPKEVFDVAFSPRGDLLASSCYDGNVYLWEAPPEPGAGP